jgi:hypothetical protein
MSSGNFLFFLKSQNNFENIVINNSEFEYDEELETVDSVFRDLSDVLYENKIHFILQINGIIYPTWDCELSIFLDSLLNMVSFCNRNDADKCEVEFYEQGIDYHIDFKKINHESYKFHFVDKGATLDTFHAENSLLALNLDLFTFYSQVVFLIDKLCPSISNAGLFVEWKKAISKQFGI